MSSPWALTTAPAKVVESTRDVKSSGRQASRRGRAALFNGLAQIIVQSTRDAGEFKLTATSGGLTPVDDGRRKRNAARRVHPIAVKLRIVFTCAVAVCFTARFASRNRIYDNESNHLDHIRTGPFALDHQPSRAGFSFRIPRCR